MIVEDFPAFRIFFRSILEQRSELRVICELSDGLEAVQRVEELKTANLVTHGTLDF